METVVRPREKEEERAEADWELYNVPQALGFGTIRGDETMDESNDTTEFAIVPIPPDTLSSTKDDLIPYIEQALRAAGYDNLLADEQIRLEIEQTFPVDATVMLGITALSRMAEEAFRQVILPALKRRYGVEEKLSNRKKLRKRQKSDR